MSADREPVHLPREVAPDAPRPAPDLDHGTDPATARALQDLTRQNAMYRRMMLVCDRVGDAALRGAPPSELTELFAQLIDRTVVLLDASFRVIAEAAGATGDDPHAWTPGDGHAARLLSQLARERRTLRVPSVPGSSLRRGFVAAPVAMGDTTLGYLLVADPPEAEGSDEVSLFITNGAATLFALPLAQQRSTVDLSQRHRAVTLDALVSGTFLDAQDARRKLSVLGMAEDRPFRIGVVAARTADGRRHRLVSSSDAADELAQHVAVRVPGAVTAVRSNDMVLLLPAPPDGDEPDDRAETRARRALQVAAELVEDVDGELTCGLSEPLDRAEAAPRGLQQAVHAIDVGVRIGRAGEVVGHDHLGIYRLLLQIGDMRQLWDFAEEVLGPLLEYDASHSLDLVGTLSVYLRELGSLKQTARWLQVHTNTVSYRIGRIEELTGLCIGDAEDRLAAHIAVKIIESQRVPDDSPQASTGS